MLQTRLNAGVSRQGQAPRQQILMLLLLLPQPLHLLQQLVALLRVGSLLLLRLTLEESGKTERRREAAFQPFQELRCFLYLLVSFRPS